MLGLQHLQPSLLKTVASIPTVSKENGGPESLGTVNGDLLAPCPGAIGPQESFLIPSFTPVYTWVFPSGKARDSS